MAHLTTNLGHDEDGNPIEVPGRWAICGRCEGHGKVDCFDGGLTSSDWHEMGPDDQDDYMAGRYDRACPECNGTGKVVEADIWDANGNVLPEYAEALKAHEDELRWKRDDAHTRRMEMGGW